MIDTNRLKDIREDNDINQEQMAKVLGVNRSTYSLWELGINIIPLKELCLFSKYFNLSIDYVLGLTNKRTKVIISKNIDFNLLGTNIKFLRNKENLSQVQLAKIIGVTQACITRYEKGIICISTSNVYKLSKKFNVSINDLVYKKLS